MIDSWQSINTIFKFYSIESYRSSLNVSDYDTQCIKNRAKEQKALSIKLVKFNLSWNLKYKRCDCDLFNKGFSPLFRNNNFIPLIYLSFYEIIFLLVVDNLNKFLSDFHNQINKVLRNFDNKIIKLNIKSVDESILLETFVFVDISIKDWLGIILT